MNEEIARGKVRTKNGVTLEISVRGTGEDCCYFVLDNPEHKVIEIRGGDEIEVFYPGLNGFEKRVIADILKIDWQFVYCAAENG
ncbi:MAG: hypothetical protein KKH88_02640 [Nanoarchaeota archaeon]|nr:hypothetical protein [Nanoarchaeota archaeon]MBU1445181.1 hypothetical protein [Nanoarchaeota archaeon]MBU2406912.1 hypothetical protein [Nanoarchaeota archaeon]MBU2420868.1 hypothetical protein [Nanoarchaeota archaeon]MBU2475339.1 hypothetical protein [Nanoarchaeota archaeon]